LTTSDHNKIDDHCIVQSHHLSSKKNSQHFGGGLNPLTPTTLNTALLSPLIIQQK